MIIPAIIKIINKKTVKPFAFQLSKLTYPVIMKKFRLLLVIFCLCFQGEIFSQKLTGIIKDGETTSLIPGANIMLTDLSGKFINNSTSDKSGHFQMKVAGQVQGKIKVSMLGYTDLEKKVQISGSDVDLGVLTLKKASYKLGEVEIKAKMPLAVQKGDTTEMNAAAYKVNPDASTQDLVEKMPGIVVQNGTVQAHGEDVKQVLLDGKDYFGDDVSTALKNIPADLIEKIQVFDKLSDQADFTGFNDGNTIKTMNIITKNGAGSTNAAKFYAGYGTDDTYNAGGVINLFSGNRRISIIAQSNNINLQNFSMADLLGVTGNNTNRRPGGTGGYSSPGGRPTGNSGPRPPGGPSGSNAGDFLVDNQNGLTATQALGINYTDSWGKKIKLSGSYFFNYTSNTKIQDIFRQYNTDQLSGQVYTENNQNQGKNINHRLNLRFEYTIDSSNSIQVRPKLTLQHNNSSAGFTGSTLSANNLLNQSTSNNSSDQSGTSFNNDILFRHKFAKKGRTFSIDINTGFNQNQGNTGLSSFSKYYSLTHISDSVLQQGEPLKNGWSASTNFAYTEPVTDKSQLMFTYKASYQVSQSDKKTFNYNYNESIYNLMDTALSNVYTSGYLTQSEGIAWSVNNSPANISLKLEYQNSSLNNDRTFPVTDKINTNYGCLLPSVMIRMKFTKNKNLQINFRTSATSPSIDQLQDVINNNDPLQLTSGNPNLHQNYLHTFFVRYITTNTDKSNTFFFLLGGNISNNYIGNNIFIASRDTVLQGNILMGKGSQLTLPENLRGYYNIRGMITYGIPVSLIKSNVNLNVTASYSRTPGIVGGQNNFATSPVIGGGIVISSNISENLDFTLSTNASYTMIMNSLQNQTNYNYVNLNNKLRLNWIFAKNFVFQNELVQQKYTGLSQGYNADNLLWNASFGYKFLKTHALDIRVSAYDILQQNKSITRTVTELYTEDANTNNLSQYFMLTLTYNLKKLKSGNSNNP